MRFVKYLCRQIGTTGVLSLGALFFIPQGYAGHGHSNHGNHRVDTDSRLSGNALEHQFWTVVQNQDLHGLHELISPAFLGRNELGSYDHGAKLNALQHLAIESFSITNMVESQEDDIRIASYDFTTTGPYPIHDHRVSVWQRKKHKHHQFFWQLISQSSFSANP